MSKTINNYSAKIMLLFKPTKKLAGENPIFHDKLSIKKAIYTAWYTKKESLIITRHHIKFGGFLHPAELLLSGMLAPLFF